VTAQPRHRVEASCQPCGSSEQADGLKGGFEEERELQ